MVRDFLPFLCTFISEHTHYPRNVFLEKLRRTAHQVTHAARVLSAICPAKRILYFLVVDRTKTVEESEAGRNVLHELRDVVLDGGAIVGGREQVPIIFREVDGGDGTCMILQGTHGFCGFEVPKNDGVVGGASREDSRV